MMIMIHSSRRHQNYILLTFQRCPWSLKLLFLRSNLLHYHRSLKRVKESLSIGSVRLPDGSFQCQKYGTYTELQYLGVWRWLKYPASYHSLQGLIQYLAFVYNAETPPPFFFFKVMKKRSTESCQGSYRSGPSIFAEKINILTSIIS